jgi:hypothetical protein
MNPTAANQQDRGDWLTPTRFAALLGVLLAVSFPGVLLGLRAFFYRDYGFLAYPFVFFHRECFWNSEVPFWNPYVNCGAPFLAQWNTCVLYPGSLIYLLLPLPWSLGIFCLFHIWLGGVGMFFLARQWTGCRFAAAVAGVAFAFSGVMLTSHIYPNYLVTLGWMPWVVLLVEHGWREGGRTLLAASLAGAMQMLTGAPELILLTWLLLAVMAVGQVSGVLNQVPPFAEVLGRFVGMVLLVAGLCAAQLLPFFDLLAHSQRDSGYAGSFWAMPGWGWANFFVPLVHCFQTSQGIFVQARQAFFPSYYLGVAVMALALLALMQVRRWRVWLLVAAAVFSILFSMGENSFVHSEVKHLVPLGFTRFPIKAVALAALALPLLAAFGVAWWMRADQAEAGKASRRLWTAGLVTIGVIAMVLVLARSFPLPTDQWPATLLNGLVRALFLGLMFAALIVCRGSLAPRTKLAGQTGALLLLWLDLVTHSPKQNPTIDPSAFVPGLAAQYFQQKGQLTPLPKLGGPRLMLSPNAELALHTRMVSDFYNDFIGQRLAFWGNLNILDGILKVNGASTLQLRQQFEIERLLYSNTTNRVDSLVDFMGVAYVTEPGELMKWAARSNAQPLVSSADVTWVPDDLNLSSLVEPSYDPLKVVYVNEETWEAAPNPKPARILNTTVGINSVTAEVEAQTHTIVSFALSFYDPVWVATVDGAPAHLMRANHAFQAVEVPRGRHQVRLVYRDGNFTKGGVVSLLTLLGICGAWCWSRKRAA